MQPIPAATVIVLRPGPDMPEILLLRRHPELAVQGGIWVFPGGHIESADGPPEDMLHAARACAIREAWEEAGLRLKRNDLIPLSRWITPAALPKRFDTWFFITVLDPAARVRIDQREIVDHRWHSAQGALEAHHRGDLTLSPPGFVVLSQLAAMGSLSHIQDQVAAVPPTCYRPRLISMPDGACILYEQDAAYQSGDINASGKRHRLWIRSSGWQYECPTDAPA